MSAEVCVCGASATAGLGPDAYWFADNDLWNKVNGSPNGFMCPSCFTGAAAAKCIAIGWRAGRIGLIEEHTASRYEELYAVALSEIEEALGELAGLSEQILYLDNHAQDNYYAAVARLRKRLGHDR